MRPLVIGHRGAPGYLPDHTLASYERAVRLGADIVEPDLVATRDGVLVARHENEIGTTTNVADVFPGRRTTRIVDGASQEGWFTEDFTLEELQRLRARQPLPFRDPSHDDAYPIATLDEVIALAARLGAERGRPVGLEPETKHPSHFRARGLPLEEPLLEALHAAGLDGPDDPVFIQSFEVGNLAWMKERTRLRLIQLIGDPGSHPADDPATPYADMLTPAGLRAVAQRAHGIGVHKGHLIPMGPDGRYGAPNDLVARAHAAGLQVHVYTFRSEPRYLEAEPSGDPLDELRRFYALGVDAVFADHPDHAVAAR